MLEALIPFHNIDVYTGSKVEEMCIRDRADAGGIHPRVGRKGHSLYV